MDIQRYKVGYYSDEWGMSSNTPCLIPDDSEYAVKFEDYLKLEAELAALKAENESLKRDAERFRWLKNNDSPIGIYYNTDFDDCYYIHEPDQTIDAAMAQGEKK